MTSDRVLITGGAGFLGINLIRFLLARGHAITSLDLAEFEYPDVRGQIRVVLLREWHDGRWWVWDRVHQRPNGPGRTLEEADRAVEELNAETE